MILRAYYVKVIIASQMGRFETEVLATEENLAALADLSGQWIDHVYDRRPPTKIILDKDFLYYWNGDT